MNVRTVARSAMQAGRRMRFIKAFRFVGDRGNELSSFGQTTTIHYSYRYVELLRLLQDLLRIFSADRIRGDFPVRLVVDGVKQAQLKPHAKRALQRAVDVVLRSKAVWQTEAVRASRGVTDKPKARSSPCCTAPRRWR